MQVDGVDEEPRPRLFLQPSSVFLFLEAGFPVNCMSLSAMLPLTLSNPTLTTQTMGMRSALSSGVPSPKIQAPYLTPPLDV